MLTHTSCFQSVQEMAAAATPLAYLQDIVRAPQGRFSEDDQTVIL